VKKTGYKKSRETVPLRNWNSKSTARCSLLQEVPTSCVAYTGESRRTRIIFFTRRIRDWGVGYIQLVGESHKKDILGLQYSSV